MTKIDPAKVYQVIVQAQAQARQRRIESGKARFTDLDEEGRRRYKAQKQRERRARLKQQEEVLGHPPMTAENMNRALLDAVFALMREGDKSVQPVVERAAQLFGVEEQHFKMALVRQAMKKETRK